jgi:hypothetical protein
MKTTIEDWKTKLYNLHNRTKGISSEHQIDYKNLLKKVFIGKDVLDVGCGTCWLKNYLPKETLYVGLDAIQRPEHINGKVIINSIEDVWAFAHKYETLFVFAALDGMRNLETALDKMKEISQKNIVILTGINIPPDQYHTHLITEEFLDAQMEGWKKTTRVQVHPKIIFLEYTK